MRVVNHSHFSSLIYRMKARTDKWGDFVCLTCQAGVHSIKSGIRYPVLVTSSTMNLWQGRRYENGYEGDPLHIDMLGIPGATVRDLAHAFNAEYGGLNSPCDVLLVSGLNNLMREHQDVNMIIEEMEEFKHDVLRNRESSFAVATLPFPPCITKIGRDRHRMT